MRDTALARLLHWYGVPTNAVRRGPSGPRFTDQPTCLMRDDQQRHGQTYDGHPRRKDAPRQFARALDCGGDPLRASTTRESRQAWPTARALGTPREGDLAAEDAPPDAA
jgi:hypothetical protein